MVKISIARALAEHKLVDKKIEKLVSQSRYCATKRGRKNETTDGIVLEEFNKNAQSSWDQSQALIRQKYALKAAIIESNAKTVITVGKQSMTVAAAIERKRSIAVEARMLQSMKADYMRAKAMTEQENSKIQAKLDQLLESNFGAGKGGSAKQEEVEAISKPYLENNQIALIDPLKMDGKIREMEAEIDEFIKNVDFALNESNVRTEVEIDMTF